MGAAQGGDHKSRMCRTGDRGRFGERVIIGRQMPETRIRAPPRLGHVVKREDTGIGDRQVRDARWAAASVRCHCHGTSHETLPFANLRNVESQGPSPHMVGLHIGARSERRHHPTASGREERNCGEHYRFQAIGCPVVALLEARVRCVRHRSQTPRCRAHVREQCGCMGGRMGSAAEYRWSAWWILQRLRLIRPPANFCGVFHPLRSLGPVQTYAETALYHILGQNTGSAHSVLPRIGGSVWRGKSTNDRRIRSHQSFRNATVTPSRRSCVVRSDRTIRLRLGTGSGVSRLYLAEDRRSG